MFSSLLPNVSSSMKFTQNGPSKPSNRFSVRVFKTAANGTFSYPLSAKLDPGYRAPPPPPPSQREQQNSNWYPTNSFGSYDQRPRGTTNFAIYPSATGDTFIYEQSTCSKSDIFSTSELDSDSFSPSSAFSPALSSDSTLALQSTPLPEPSLDDQRGSRPSTPSPRTGYSHTTAAPQGAPLGRTASTSHHIHEAPTESIEEHRSRLTSLPGRSSTPFRASMPSAIVAMARAPSVGGFIQIPEYEASTFSELEVEERDRIAQINAEYNAAASASYYSSSTGFSDDANRHPMLVKPQNSPTSGRDYPARVASSQPLHPNLHFPVRPSEPEFTQPTVYPTSAPAPPSFTHNASMHDSPPSVERVSSQLPPEYQVPHASVPSPQHHTSPISDIRSRETAYQPEPSLAPSYWTSPKNVSESFDSSSAPSSRSAHATYGTSSQERTSPQQHHQDLHTPLSNTSRRRSSVVGPRPDLRPLSEVRDYGLSRGTEYRQLDIPPSKSGSDSSSSTQRDYRYRDHRDVAQSPIRESVAETSPRDLSRNAALGSELRRDTRTPAPRDSEEYRPVPPSRRNSYAPDAPRSPKESRTPSQAGKEVREVYKPGPLSSSPTQMRLSPTELESGRPSGSSPTRPLHVISENERSHERPRTRSNSFSAPIRPNLPVQNVTPDSRHASEYERPRRTDRTTGYKDDEPSRRPSRAEPERRGDQHTSNSQPYHSQAATPFPSYESHSPPHQSSSRTMDRSISSQQNTATSHSRTTAQEPNSRPRTSHPEPDYQADVPRGRSDGDRQYGTSNQPPRSATQYENQPTATAKYTDTAGNVRTTAPVSTASSEPQRRYSDGDQSPPVRPQLSGRNSAPLLRSVRWNENLICPSPVFASQRRKGFFNRRGDQLWTNDGAYKAAPAGQEYPPDLDDYPEHGEGWMNEECVRIDLNHRLIPKPPLRSALKQTRV